MPFITYVIPWLASEPKDAFEDVGAVEIIAASESLDEAKEIAREYAEDNLDENLDDDDGDQLYIVVDDKDDDDDDNGIYQIIYVSRTPISDDPECVQFNEINGYAVVIKYI